MPQIGITYLPDKNNYYIFVTSNYKLGDFVQYDNNSKNINDYFDMWKGMCRENKWADASRQEKLASLAAYRGIGSCTNETFAGTE